MNEQRNIILAILLSAAVFAGWHFFYEAPRQEKLQAEIKAEQAAREIKAPQDVIKAEKTAEPVVPQSRAEVVSSSKRIQIKTPSLTGSIRLQGARLDDLTLSKYHVSVQNSKEEIILLSPNGSGNPYFSDFGWASADTSLVLPNQDTPWQTDSDLLTPEKPVTLTWDNGHGLIFTRVISVDNDYMFTITQRVTNNMGKDVSLSPFALISRAGKPHVSGFAVLHEGPIGYLNNSLEELSYKNLNEDKTITKASKGGWLGITDKYWLTALIPGKDLEQKANFRDVSTGDAERYQVDYVGAAQVVNAGNSVETKSHFFAGAKVIDILDGYEKKIGIEHFDLAVDFGWFYFITKPMFYALDYIQNYVGNFGLAILILTVLLKLLFFPLANKSYRSMARMKSLQPEMERIRSLFQDDKMRMNQEVMALYKREKVNPMAGCVPMVIQIPVFFALYKVLFISIEMRHAPFYGWIQDLSAPDPTTIFNLFGLIPWTPPSFLMMGAWPLIMGLTMFLQQKLNPPPADPAQQKIFMLMPIIFTFMLAGFPAGLVIYWTWNNIISIGQQWAIMKMASQEKPVSRSQNFKKKKK